MTALSNQPKKREIRAERKWCDARRVDNRDLIEDRLRPLVTMSN